MLAFLVNFVHAFIPLSLVIGLLIPLLPQTGGKRPCRPLMIAVACGILAGCILHPLALRHETITAARTVLNGTALAAALLNAAALVFIPQRSRIRDTLVHGAALFFAGTLAVVSGFSFSAFVTEQTVSASSVLNTELILNLAGILAGLSLTGLLVPLTVHMSARNGKRTVRGLLLLVSALLMTAWSADLLLGMMRLELVELTSTRVSIVARIGKYTPLISYLLILAVATLSLAFFRNRPKAAPDALAEMGMAERRKTLSRVLLEQRWFRGALATVLLLVTALLYHDLYASRPPKISEPLRLTPDNRGIIRVKVEDLADGNLHRYAYVTDDGHVVRFFMINRSGGRKIGVVYDACMLCGDMGYLQEKNEVICIACNVRIFIPSIGKAGGCNPIPLPHQIEGGEVLVSAAELDKGARYFSQVVTVKVKDPVSGKELISRDAPQRYEYKGRTYFFESAGTLERFQAEPDKYVGQQESRYFRAQGFRES